MDIFHYIEIPSHYREKYVYDRKTTYGKALSEVAKGN